MAPRRLSWLIGALLALAVTASAAAEARVLFPSAVGPANGPATAIAG